MQLVDYISLCSGLFGWDLEKQALVSAQANNAIKYYNAPKQLRFEELHTLETRWYQSLANKEPDFSVYDTDLMLADVWACWRVYSQGYIKTLVSEKSLFTTSIVNDMGNMSSVVDLGCGAGCTTAALKEIFPNACVYGTNIEGTKQYRVAQENGHLFNFSVLPVASHVNEKGGLVFASEYFEHFYKPVDHLIEILDALSPNCLLVANSFSSRSVGHFDEYSCHNELYGNKEMGRVFNKELRSFGYDKVKTKCWNDRPSYWKKS